MHSNQLSNAFELNSQLTLKEVKKFPIQRSVGRLEPLRHSYHPEAVKKPLKIELKRQPIKTKAPANSIMKTAADWHQLVKNMKKELYVSQGNKDLKQNKRSRCYEG